MPFAYRPESGRGQLQETAASPLTGFGNVERGTAISDADATELIAESSGPGLFETGAAGIALAVPDLIDTVLTSLPGSNSILGLERGDVITGLASATGIDALEGFVARNRGAAEVGSGIAGVIATSIGVGALFRGAAVHGRFLGSSRLGSYAAKLQRNVDEAKVLVQEAGVASAGQAATGSELFAGNIMLRNTEVTAAFAKRQFIGAKLKLGLAENVTVEAALAATMNENSMLFSESTSDNLAAGALGLGAGAFLDRIQAGYGLRKLAQSDSISRARSLAFDPLGLESQRIQAEFKEFGPEFLERMEISNTNGFLLDLATSYNLSARASRGVTEEVNAAVSTKRRGLAITQEQGFIDTMQKVVVQGIPGEQATKFGLKNNEYGAAIRSIASRDPSAFHLAESVGAIRPTMDTEAMAIRRDINLSQLATEIETNLARGGVERTRKFTKNGKKIEQTYIKKFNKEQMKIQQKKLHEIRAAQNLEEMHVVDSELVPASVGRLFDGYQPPKVAVESIGDTKLYKAILDDGKEIGVDDSGKLILRRGQNEAKLSLNESLASYEAAGRFVKSFAAEPNKKLTLPQNPTIMQLDIAEQVLRDTDDLSRVEFPPGMTRESALATSFKKKAKLFKSIKSKDDKTLDAMKYKLNLPRLTSFEKGLDNVELHPTEQLLRMSSKELDKMSHGDLIKGINELRAMNKMTDGIAQKTDDLMGNMFNFQKSSAGEHTGRLIVYKRPAKPHEWTKDNLEDRLAVAKAIQMSKLFGEDAGALNNELAQLLTESPDIQTISRLDDLNDAQLQSSLPGTLTAAPTGERQKFLGAFLTRETRDRDAPVLLAASRIQDNVDRLTRYRMQEMMERHMGNAVTTLNGPANVASRFNVSNFKHFRPGWDLLQKKGVTVFESTKGKNGKTVQKAVLDPKSPINQKRWKQVFGEEMPQKAFLRGQGGKDVVIDTLAMDYLRRSDGLSKEINELFNGLREANGMARVNPVPYYSNPPPTKGQFIGFIFDKTGEVMPGGLIRANTAEELNAIYQRQLKDPKSLLNKEGAYFQEKHQVEDFNTLWDKANQEFIDPGSTTAVLGGRRSEGKLSGPELNPAVIEESLLWARDSILNHGQQVMRTMLDSQIRAIKSRARIGSPATQVAGSTEVRDANAFDMMLENLLGRSVIDRQGTWLGDTSRKTERRLDSALNRVAPKTAAAKGKIRTWVSEVVPSRVKPEMQEEFNLIRDTLADDMPFDSALEYAEKMTGKKRSATLAEITGNMSKFEAAMRLRMFEVMHPALNLGGMINAAPSVIRQYRRLSSETAEDYASRVGHNAEIFNFNDGKNSIGLLDMHKVIRETFSEAWDRKQLAVWDDMQKFGYATQEVAELNRQYALSDSPGRLKRFALGNPTADTSTALGKIESKGIVGWTSVLSDMSEDFSRSWGHMIGLKIADRVGIEPGTKAAHQFAHDIANKMIANYDPKNRPPIFQGALGAPVGLFASFIMNFYQRMFRAVEIGDYQTAAIQYATQAGLFGAGSVPGWEEFSSLLFRDSDGKNSPDDAIYRRFGKEGGDLILNGALSNLPKMLNLLPGIDGVGGIDFRTRGDTNVRLPVLNAPPVVDTVSRLYQGFSQAIGGLASEGELSGNQLAEIVSNTLTNRPLAGFLEVAGANGYDTDWQGSVASESRGFMENALRIAGTKSLRQQSELRAFYSNKEAQELQAAKMDKLRRRTRAAIRDGDFDSVPEYFTDYVERGGDPNRFNSWIRENIDAATDTRAERMLEKFAKSGRRPELLERLVAAGVEIDGDDEEEEFEYDPAEDAELQAEQEALNRQNAGVYDIGDGQFAQEPESDDLFGGLSPELF